MRLSRTDLVPMLAIIGGGTLSVLISGSPALWSPSDDVPALGHRVAPSGEADVGEPFWGDDGTIVFRSPTGLYRMPETGGEPVLLYEQAKRFRPVWSPDGQRIAYTSDASGEPQIYVRGVPEVTDWQRALVYIDGMRVETSFFESLNTDDIESIEVVKGDAAVALYGEEASSGVIWISLKEARHRR